MADYHNAVFAKSRFFIAFSNFSPVSMRSKQKLTEKQAPDPPLSRFSDVAFLQ